MEKTAKARIAYSGPALETGDMDVRELAPALIAFADLVENANRVLGGQQKIRVMLNQDSIKRGSFDITFLLDANILDEAKLLLGWADELRLSDLLAALGWDAVGKAADVVTLAQAAKGILVGGGVFKLIQWVRGRQLANITHPEKGKAEITLQDGEKGIVDEKTLKVFLDVNCRISIEKIVHPLSKEGIDSFELRDPAKGDSAPIETITVEDVPNFVAPSAKPMEDETPEPPPEQEILARIISINFEKGKWRLTDGTNAFWVSMCDEEFNKRVESREIAFASGDMLKIRYHIEQAVKGGKLSSDYIVTKVMELKKQPQQIELPFEYEQKE